ncbi:hypothetical protein K9N68_17125 [Kovacikia minuta CCNUW1]|uniref:hypothetical protein n=1 Tax=Kovacikia minuta TaxID=2931930 RepID=UPI001CCA172B|nr:hypothetical protein [Kovacikia minuta]UBF29401.1 hypothetical protein K9N68_17125 [Kovacikia minuta CCNUW1]
MQDGSEILQRKLLKLLQDLIPTDAPTDVEASGQRSSESQESSPHSSRFSLTQDASSAISSQYGSENIPSERETLFELGEIPAVQDRFYSLLKQRLQTEIQQNPPLFPWETEVNDYETEYAPYGVPGSGEALGVGISAGQPTSSGGGMDSPTEKL